MKTIKTAEQLLGKLKEHVFIATYPRLRVESVIRLGKPSLLRVEYAQEKKEYTVHLLIQPSRKCLDDAHLKKGGFLFAPHIPAPLSQDLRVAQIPHGDLNGRLFLFMDGLLVDVRPEKVLYKPERKGPRIFADKPTRILRVLLNHREQEFSQVELVGRTGVSRTLVSQVLNQLSEEKYVTQTCEAGRSSVARYRLEEFDRLLDDWAAADHWLKRVTLHQYSLFSNDPDDISRKLRESLGEENLAFTQWVAAWQRFPHTTVPVVSAYLKNSKLLDAAPWRRVPSGGNVWLITPKDEGVWQDGRTVNGLPLVSDVQIYLDLLQVSQRGPEAATELRQWKGFAR